MAPKRRYYSDEDTENGITRSQLKRAGRNRQKEYISHWFYRNFEDPTQETPYNSEEGGYLFIWGGPYNAHEELSDEFGALVPERRIQEIADEIENEDGINDWAPGPDHPGTKEREEDFYRDLDELEDETPSETDRLNQVIRQLQSGAKPKYGDGYEFEQRRIIQERLAELEAALAHVTPAHGGMGHNMPPNIVHRQGWSLTFVTLKKRSAEN